MRGLGSWLAALAALAGAPSEAGAEGAPAAARILAPAKDEGISTHRLAVSVGFSHWFGPTFGSPDGYTTPVFAVGVRPAVSFLEIKARYTRSAVSAPLPGGGRGLVGFAALELLLTREIRVGNQSLNGFLGPLAALSHAGGPGVGGGVGAVLGAEYLVHMGLGCRHAAGVFVAVHEVFYGLPQDTASLTHHPRRDAQIDLGVVTTLF